MEPHSLSPGLESSAPVATTTVSTITAASATKSPQNLTLETLPVNQSDDFNQWMDEIQKQSPFYLSDQKMSNLQLKSCDFKSFRESQYLLGYGVSSWYKNLEHITFKSDIIPITYDQALGLLNYRIAHHPDSPKNTKQMAIDTLKDPATRSGSQNDFDVLRLNIANSISTNFSIAGCFVKLNLRSPKDVPMILYENKDFQNRVREILNLKIPSPKNAATNPPIPSTATSLEEPTATSSVEFGNLPQENTFSGKSRGKTQSKISTPPDDAPIKGRPLQDELILLLSGLGRCLFVKNVQDAIQLLIYSQRIYEDLSKQLLLYPKSVFQSKIVLREWVDWVVDYPSSEYRGFVYENKLVGITQYNQHFYFPHIVEQKDQLSFGMQEIFYKHVEPHLRWIKSYVVDFACMKESIVSTKYPKSLSVGKVSTNGYRCIIIELNPYSSLTGAGLFHWKHDKSVLDGSSPFQFRVQTKRGSIEPLVPRKWFPFLNKTLGYPENQDIPAAKSREEILAQFNSQNPDTIIGDQNQSTCVLI